MDILYVLLVVVACFVGIILLIILVYVLSRAAAMGWYRSKLEHMKKMWAHIPNGGNENGEF